MELQPEPGREVFVEIRRTPGWEIILDDFDYVVTLDPGDMDGDGLPDAWEIEYFGDLTTSDGTGDFDGDWGGVAPLIEVWGDGLSKQFTNDSPNRTGFFRLTVEKP